MAIITISRGSYSMGAHVAEQVARRLNYDIVHRDILLDASDRFNIPEFKLIQAIHDAPGIFARYGHAKQTYIAYIRAALTKRVASDNVVYHGLAGHLLLQTIPHVLKVRINTDIETRVKNEMSRQSIDADTARNLLVEDDKQRRKWTKDLYGEDPWNSALYDLTICIDKLAVDDAVDFICRASQTNAFTATEQSLQQAKDLATACHVKAMIVDDFPDAGVTCEYGNVLIHVKPREYNAGRLTKRIDDISRSDESIYNIEIHPETTVPPEAV